MPHQTPYLQCGIFVAAVGIRATLLSDASGNFTVTGVAPGRYTIRVQGQIQGTTLKSAATGGRMKFRAAKV